MLIKEEPHPTTTELTHEMASSHVTITHPLHSAGKVQKHIAWVPHVLTERNKFQNTSIASSLLTHIQATCGYKERTCSTTLPLQTTNFFSHFLTNNNNIQQQCGA